MVQLNVFLGAAQLQQDFAGIPMWVILVIVLLVVAVGVIWFLNQENKDKPKPVAMETDEVMPPEIVGTEGEHIVAQTVEPDDLQIIEGIGPKLSQVLQQAGISTWAGLAASDSSQLRQILDDAGISQISDPTSWPKQAALAAAGDWDALEEFQSELKGGRHV